MRRICSLLLSSLALFVGMTPTHAETTIPVPARSTFLHVVNDPSADTTLVVDLQSLGITNGMTIRLERLGDYTFFNTTSPDSDYAKAMLGVFSFTSQVLSGSSLSRIPGVLTSTLPSIATKVSLVGSQATDIPQDFRIGDSTVVRVPAGGNFLMISTDDVFYGDNQDPDNDLALRITILDTNGYAPASCLWNVTTNTTLAAGDLSHENCVVNINGATLTLAGRHQFAALSLVSSAVVTSLPLDSLRIDLLGDLVVGAGSAVSVNGRGYPGASGPGAGESRAACSGGGGGSHGGTGGTSYVGAVGGNTYGSIVEPAGFGSGGGTASGSVGGAGGGAMAITVAGELQVNGAVSADGLNGLNGGGCYSGGGSGGSVWLTAGSISGSGVITARGGNGIGTTYPGGGGGGRIALYYGQTSFAGALRCWGGSGFQYGGAGTIFTKLAGPSLGTLLVDNGGIANNAARTDLDTVTVVPGHLRVSNMGVVSVRRTSRLRLTVQGDAIVDATGAISLDGRGYAAASGPGAGENRADCSGGGGGSHGGTGGTSYVNASGGSTYGSIVEPSDFGSGGGNAAGSGGGAGGGALYIAVAGELQVNGVMSADGANGISGSTCYSGGGSGGSLWITALNISGSGVISARGGNGIGTSFPGGGGGGRIALYYGQTSFAGALRCWGGSGFQYGGAGTIFTKLAGPSLGTLLVDNGGIANNAARTDLDTVTVVPGHLRVSNMGVVSVRRTSRLRLTVQGDAIVDATGAISLDGRGYAAASGPGAGENRADCSGGGGGSHGGTGGTSYVNASGGSTYGSIVEPSDFGSGGGNAAGSVGGSGGGVLFMSVAGQLQVNGAVSANGVNGVNSSGCYSGGGSGGSVWVTAGSISGSGVISARGGNGIGTSFPGGGGGGRIALYYGQMSFAGALRCWGGSGFQYGGAGTIFTKLSGPSLGTLLVDNGGVASSAARTDMDTVTVVPGHLLVSNRGVVSVRGMSRLRLTVQGDVVVDPTGAISVDGRGYSAASGPGAGESRASCSGGGGGSYGGSGGMSYVGAAGGSTYGSMVEPADFGSGGGNASASPGGAGGGVLIMNVAGQLTVNGAVSAEGANGVNWSGCYSGGGSGGGIWVTTGSISGTGVLSARGGNGLGSSYPGGGGGGRIAIFTYCWPNFAEPRVSATGGSGYRAGQAGTIYPNVGLTGLAAGVITTTGNIRVRRVTDSLDLGGLESNDSLWIFNERTSALPSPSERVVLEISQPGTVTQVSQFTPFTIDTGTYVSSHVIHFDPVNDGSGDLRGGVTFDTDVLGLIVTSAALDASDSQLHRPGVTYASALSTRGAEFDNSIEQDSVTISADRRSVTFTSHVSSGIDEIRVITAIPPGSCGAVDVPPDDPALQPAPHELAFSPPSPNPTRGAVRLSFGLPHAGRASLEVYDISGRRVVSLVDANLSAGWYTRRWDGTGADGIRRGPGAYFARLVTREGARTQRLTIIR